MKCITSPALEDTQIVSYMEGEADAVVVAHINECAFCRERAERWTLLQNGLKKQLYRVTCPTSMELGDYHLKLLPAPQALIIAQHVRECPLCRREVAELEDFVGAQVIGDGLLGTANVLIARLIGGESGLMPSQAALRGEDKGPLTLEADGIVIVLDIQPAEGGMATVLGQVAADDQDQWTGALVELDQDGRLEFSTTLDDLGAFEAEGIMPGSKELRIISQDHFLTVVSSFNVSI
jgi:hypothetical protein